MKIVYTVSLALIALLGASTTTSAQEITPVDLDANVLAPAEIGAEGETEVDAADTTGVVTGAEDAAPADSEAVGAEGDVGSLTLPIARQNVIMAVIKKRQEAGLPTVCLSSKLMDTAQSQAIYLASTNSLTMTGKDGSSPSDRGRAAGFNSTGVAELVGAGYTTADALINVWLQSADSKSILLGDYTHIGPGYTVDEKQQYKYYWAVDFSKGVGEACSGLVA